MLHFLRRVGLARLLRPGLTLVIPPLWYEIALLHYRGAFQSRFMWVPVLSLPAVVSIGLVSSLQREDRRSRESKYEAYGKNTRLLFCWSTKLCRNTKSALNW